MVDRKEIESWIRTPFLSGLIAGSSGTIVAYPFDVVKTYSQLNQTPNMLTSFSQIWRQSGLFGFYRGLTSPLIFRSSVKGVLYASYEKSMQLPLLRDVNPYLKMSIAGLIAGLVSSPMCSLMELIKITNQRGVKFRHLIKQQGLPIVFKGVPQSLMREAPYYTIYFPLYHFAKENNLPFAGGIAGTVPWIITYPLDVIKSLKQDPLVKMSPQTFYQRYGIRGFFNGLTPTMLRAFPTHFVTWKVYEWLKPNQ